MKTFGFTSLIITAAAMLLTGCSDKKWSASGEIAGASGRSLILEAPNGAGGWYGMDTVTIADNGSFSLKGEQPGHPQLLRLNLDGQMVYFPIDSTESVVITADASALQRTARISGSESADRMQEVNDLIAKTVAASGDSVAPYDANLKRALAEIILRNPSDVVAYYLVFHRVGGRLFFSPDDKSDLRIIGAVANAFTQQRPSDPRTPLLKQLYLSNRRNVMAERPDTLAAEMVGFPEIALFDETGTMRSLTDAASRGKVVLLCFTAYTAEGSQALNVALNKLYEANHSRGLEIYQVSFDDDEYQWKQSAKNLPWTTVYNSAKEGANTLTSYNIGALPAIFIINREGELVERVDRLNRLESTVNRYL